MLFCKCDDGGCTVMQQRNSQGCSQPTESEHTAALSDVEWPIVPGVCVKSALEHWLTAEMGRVRKKLRS